MGSSELLINTVKSPDDLKGMSHSQLKQLAQEIRERIVAIVSKNGGHLASNLGTVELTLALHRSFDFKKDRLIWDVGHQCYTHKIITGRNGSMDTIRKKNGLSGFPKRTESDFDAFDTGHASTSISASLGFAEAFHFLEKEERAVAVIGDGALTGGMAFEALNHAGYLKRNLIVVLNDNEMSISRNVGALSSSPTKGLISSTISFFTSTSGYQSYRRITDKIISKIPLIGKPTLKVRLRIKKALRALLLKEDIFSQLGFDYIGPVDGHDMKRLESVFNHAKRLNGPVFIHVRTLKGRGIEYAENNPSRYHGVGSFSINDGKLDEKSTLNFTDCFSQLMVAEGEKNPHLVAVTAAMIDGTGLSEFGAQFPSRLYDVGIAEQHALTFAAGLAAGGLKPVVAVYSTFMQRAVDQLIHDIAIPNLDVVFVMSRSGFVDADGETHQGLYDLALFRTVPNTTLLMPAGAVDFKLMLEYALKTKGPVLIRIPKALCSFSSQLSQPIVEGEGIFIHNNRSKTLLISSGALFENVESATSQLLREGIDCDHYLLRFLKPLNEEKLVQIVSSYQRIFLFEDHASIGGCGDVLGALIAKHNIRVQYYPYGAEDRFFAQADRKSLLEENGLSSSKIIQAVKSVIS